MIRPAKFLFYIIELINSYAAVYYSNFLFFYLQRTFGFGEVGNLLTAALGGFVYVIAAWQGGKLAQRYGCIRLLALGCCGVILSLTLGLFFTTAPVQIIVFCLWTVGVCCIWPSLESLISERAGASLAKMVGIYNIIWAAGSALGYFTAGILIEKLGMASVFWLPLVLTTVELAIVFWAASYRKKENDYPEQDEPLAEAVNAAKAQQFLQMAWFANPCSYVAINTVIPLIPSIAGKLHFSTGMAGIVCSIWMFARLVAFAVLWQWTGWHYRFRWLGGGFSADDYLLLRNSPDAVNRRAVGYPGRFRSGHRAYLLFVSLLFNERDKEPCGQCRPSRSDDRGGAADRSGCRRR